MNEQALSSNTVTAHSPIIETVGIKKINKMMDLMVGKALDGDFKALLFFLDRAFPVRKVMTYTRVDVNQKLETQRDIDNAMSTTILKAVSGGPNQISLEEAAMITDLLIKKKETMDECLHGEVVELQKKIGMVV